MKMGSDQDKWEAFTKKIEEDKVHYEGISGF